MPAHSASARRKSPAPAQRRPSLDWLAAMLARNRSTEYLRTFGAPATLDEFRSRVPPCGYEDLAPWIARLHRTPDVLFAGKPAAYERTGGSSGGSKLIAYSREGLLDFQLSVGPWLTGTMARYGICGSVYFSISPATRKPQVIGDIPVGLPDAAYLGEAAGSALQRRSAVPAAVGELTDVGSWRRATLRHLAGARDLELISVWSPTFLLRLLDDLPDAAQRWPRLKLVSCWASGPSGKFADEVRRRLPHAEIQPKGLLSTEAVVTVPDETSRPALVEHGFWEFADGEELLLEDQLRPGDVYEVVATTASGLYRYRTGDSVRFDGMNPQGRPILEFTGRNSLACDLVGEKLTEAFAGNCLQSIPGYALLVPCIDPPGYVLVCESPMGPAQARAVERRLAGNPQYAYARRIGQLAPLRVMVRSRASSVVERRLLSRGVRLADLKPLALRSETFWLPLFAQESP